MSEESSKKTREEERTIPWAEGNGVWNAISGLVSDLTAVDLVTFFVQNPFFCDTADGLAVRVGRRAGDIQAILDDLAETGFVRVTILDSERVYDLTEDPQRRQTLQQYVTWLQEGYHWARLAIDQS